MKKETMIKVLRYKAEHIKTKIQPEFFAEVADMLEQEPSEDAISRADAVKVASGYCHPANIAKELAKLPPVQPKPKVGHWIEGQTDNPNIHNILCSCCFEGYPSKGHANSQYTKDKFQWCPKCGAKMIEPQKSEG